MADAIFEDPRLALLYDPFEGERDDLDAYVAIAQDVGARSILDVGCGTGVFALRLADLGMTVIAIEPAVASLKIARAKPGADRVTWLAGSAANIPSLQVDLVTMTANVAQVFVRDEEWSDVLRAVHAALAEGGHLVFETRDPQREAWREWVRERTYESMEVEGAGLVTTWCDLLEVGDGIVSFRWTNVFESDGTVIESDSTVRFRSRDEVIASLEAAGFEVEEIRDAPDRPGREFVFLARKLTTRKQAVLMTTDNVVTLWRPTGPEELDLVRSTGSKRWPPRLPDQPIFYPVLNEDYAIRIARDWNVKASGVGYVTRFAVRKEYLERFEVHQVGGETILEYWIPAESLDELNDNIVGTIDEIIRFELKEGEVVATQIDDATRSAHRLAVFGGSDPEADPVPRR